MKKITSIIAIACLLQFLPFANATAQKYDMEIILDKIRCLKVVEGPFDTQEDIFGFIGIESYVMKNAVGKLEKFGNLRLSSPFYEEETAIKDISFPLFNRLSNDPLHIGLSPAVSSGISFKRSNLNYNQLISFEGLLGGSIKDEETLTFNNIKYQACTSCSYIEMNDPDEHAYRLLRMVYYKSQIDAMATNTSQFMTIGTDKIMQLDFFEGDNNSSHIRFEFKIKVTKSVK